MIGWGHGIEGPGREDALAYYERFYTPENAYWSSPATSRRRRRSAGEEQRPVRPHGKRRHAFARATQARRQATVTVADHRVESPPGNPPISARATSPALPARRKRSKCWRMSRRRPTSFSIAHLVVEGRQAVAAGAGLRGLGARRHPLHSLRHAGPGRDLTNSTPSSTRRSKPSSPRAWPRPSWSGARRGSSPRPFTPRTARSRWRAGMAPPCRRASRRRCSGVAGAHRSRHRRGRRRRRENLAEPPPRRHRLPDPARNIAPPEPPAQGNVRMNKRAAPPAATHAVKCRQIASPGGIKAWLVEDYAVPIVAWSSRCAAAPRRIRPLGAATILAGLLDEGAGDLDPGLPPRARGEGDRVGFPADSTRSRAGCGPCQKPRPRRRAAGPRGQRAAFRRGAVRSRPRADKAHLRHEINDPGSVAWRGFRSRVFNGHPYEHPSEGSLETLDAIERADMTGLHAAPRPRRPACRGRRRHGRRPRRARLDEAFSHLPAQAKLDARRRRAVPRTRRRNGDRPRRAADDDPLRPPAPARDDADYIPAFVLTHILGGGTGLSSRLFREVREKRGLAYNVYAGLST